MVNNEKAIMMARRERERVNEQETMQDRENNNTTGYANTSHLMTPPMQGPYHGLQGPWLEFGTLSLVP